MENYCKKESGRKVLLATNAVLLTSGLLLTTSLSTFASESNRGVFCCK